MHWVFYFDHIGKDLPKRPSFGKAGRKIVLRSNFFELKFKDNVIYQYDISIEPSKCPSSLNRTIIENLIRSYEQIFKKDKPVYDGKKNLYTINPLPIGNAKV